jgi:hypothetical protein
MRTLRLIRRLLEGPCARELALQSRACRVGLNVTSVNRSSGNDGKRLGQSTAVDFPGQLCDGRGERRFGRGCDGGGGGAIVKTRKAQSRSGRASNRIPRCPRRLEWQ